MRGCLGRRPEGPCVVTFDPMVDDPALDRVAFGEAFFAAHGIDALHILSDRNGWYQDADLPQALAAVYAATRSYARVMAYGSSMGGYAALRFSAAVGAHAVLALSPQYSMLPAVVPFERRWRHEAARTAWHHERPGDPLPKVGDALILYDDRTDDAGHAAAILRDLPAATALPLRHAGHPVGALLAELGLMGSTTRAFAEGRLDAAALARTIRAERRRSGQYLFTLAQRQPLCRLRLKARLALRATQAAQPTPHGLTYAGLVLECAGRPSEAQALHAAAAALRPPAGFSTLHHAYVLLRLERPIEAMAAAEQARHLMPLLVEPVELCALLRAAAGEPADALQLWAASPRYRRRPDLIRLFHTAARWPLLRLRPVRALAARLATMHLRRTILAAHHPLRQLKLAERPPGQT